MIKFKPLKEERLDLKALNYEKQKSYFQELICKNSSEEVFNFIIKYSKLDNHNTLLLSSDTQYNIDVLLKRKQQNIINLNKINDILKINKFVRVVNSKLPFNGIFIGCVETNYAKKVKIYAKHSRFVAFFHFLIYYIFKRIFPKLSITRGLYFLITKGRNRAISKAETFGRLIFCGFEIIEFIENNNLIYFAAKKVKQPVKFIKPSYGLFFKMSRIGKGGKIICVYKIRTMHPYSEFLQDYIYKSNQLDKGGKFKDDFRISTTGYFFRKLWIDELPMLINFFKRELKLIGVRPLSIHYFNLYSKELQERRIKYKPGLIPPYYIDMPETLEEIMVSEIKYLDKYDKNPILIDIKYFFLFLKNIIISKAKTK